MSEFVPPPTGWLKGLLTAPFKTMHQHLHKLRQATPPAEHPTLIPIHDARGPEVIPTGNMPPPKAVPLKQQVRTPAERRDSSPIPSFPLRPPYDQ